jgi:hypothetical protein
MRWQGFLLLLIAVALRCSAMPTAVAAEQLMLDDAAIESEQERFEIAALPPMPAADVHSTTTKSP